MWQIYQPHLGNLGGENMSVYAYALPSVCRFIPLPEILISLCFLSLAILLQIIIAHGNQINYGIYIRCIDTNKVNIIAWQT